MIIDFSVQNFGSIKDKQTLSFEADKSTHLEDYYVVKVGKYRLLKLALIYGANASGKTTVLKALHLLGELANQPVVTKAHKLEVTPFLFDEDTPNQNTIFSIRFIEKKIVYEYALEFNKECVVKEELYSHDPNRANLFKRVTDIKKQLTKITFGNKVKLDTTHKRSLEANTLWNNTVFGGLSKTNIDVKEFKNVKNWIVNYLTPLIDSQTVFHPYTVTQIDEKKVTKEEIVRILRKADFNISDLKIEKNVQSVTEELIKTLEKSNASNSFLEILKERGEIVDIDIQFIHTRDGKKYLLPIENESEGTQRYFGMAAVLNTLIKAAVITPIDELESSLHPDLYMHFLLTFLANSKGSQLIATTHNREILNNKDIFRNDAIWFTDKSQTGATELYSLADFGTDVVRDSTNVLNAYKTGKLGGVPNLGDYYIDLSK